jgi:hypothetical protein
MTEAGKLNAHDVSISDSKLWLSFLKVHDHAACEMSNTFGIQALLAPGSFILLDEYRERENQAVDEHTKAVLETVM